MRTDNEDFIKREIIANVIESDEVTFLCGKSTLKDMKTTLDFAEDKLEFKEKGKNIELMVSAGGHMMAKLELVGKWNDEDVVYLVKNEKDVKSVKSIKKIHKILNHKTKDQMYYVYRNAGQLDDETKRIINEVIEKCEICKRNSRS